MSHVQNSFNADKLRGIFQEMDGQKGHKRERLHLAFLKMIEQGYWNPGDRLPSDKDLANEFPVSLATVQAAMQNLAEQNLVTRARRNGSFVRDSCTLPGENGLLRFVEPETGHSLTGEVVDAAAEIATDQGHWSMFFGQRPNYLRIERQFDFSGQFSVLSEFFLADPAFYVLGDLSQDVLRDQPILQHLQIRFRKPATGFTWRTRIVSIGARYAQAIGLKVGETAQEFSVFIRTIDDQPLAVHRFFVPPNDFALSIDGK